MFGIGSGLSLIALIGHLVPAPSFAPVVASLIGLGGGVDYALFIVTRFREALRAGRSESAVVTAFSTAGRAVLFAGTTVIIAVLGLLLRQPLMNDVAVAAAVTVACVLAGSLTLLPALLGFAGTRLAKRSRLTRRTRGGEAEPSRSVSTRVGAKPAGSARQVPLAERWVGGMQRRPVFAAAASAAVILALAAPVLAIHLNLPDESTQPPDTMGYQSYQTIAERFAPGSTRR